MACASAGSFIMPNNVISMKIKSIYKISFRFVLWRFLTIFTLPLFTHLFSSGHVTQMINRK